MILNIILMKNNRTYFQTFDALRFFAFVKVFLFHIPIWGFPVFDFIKEGGGAAVSFFFSLSGFLITYIILEEKKRTGTLDLKAFYVRRILRIWPLYYIMVVFAFITPFILSLISITASGDGYTPNWLMSAFFLENYKMIATDSFPNVSPLGVMWSLCVEEHFYLIWGLVLYIVSIRNIHWLVVGSIIFANIARGVFYMQGWSFLDVCTNIDYFAYGAVPAILLILYKERMELFMETLASGVKISIIIISALIVLTLPNLALPFKLLIEPTILGFAHLLIIAAVVFEKKLFTIPQKNILSRLGIYTYGFYLTHTIVINLFVKIFDKKHIPLESPLVALVFVGVCMGGTIAAGMCSYYVIEKPFLTLKKRFS